MPQFLFDCVAFCILVFVIALPTFVVKLSLPFISSFDATLEVPIAFLIILYSVLFCFALLTHLVPRPKPGKYAFPYSQAVILWGFHFSVQRVASFALFRNVFMSFNILRYLYLKSLGAKIHFQTWISSNFEFTELYEITVKKGAMLASRSELGCHMIRDGHFLLGSVLIEEGAQILIDVGVGPDCVVGKNAVIEFGTKLGYKVHIGESTLIGNRCMLESHVKVGDRVRIGDLVTIESAVCIDDGVVIPSGTWIRRGARVTKDTVFESQRWQEVKRVRAPHRKELC